LSYTKLSTKSHLTVNIFLPHPVYQSQEYLRGFLSLNINQSIKFRRNIGVTQRNFIPPLKVSSYDEYCIIIITLLLTRLLSDYFPYGLTRELKGQQCNHAQPAVNTAKKHQTVNKLKYLAEYKEVYQFHTRKIPKKNLLLLS